MLSRRNRPPVLAELPRPGVKRRPGSLGRSELAAFEGLLEGLGEARVVLVTGGGNDRQAGALGLATVAVAAGRYAALVECDLAVPALAAKVGLAAGPGLHEYLRGEARAAEILQPLALAGPASRGAATALVCVAAGAATAEGPSLLDSERFGEALARMRAAYDLVVLDGPPLEAEYSLRQVAKLVDLTLASVPRPGAAKRLPVPVGGLLVQR